MKQRIIKTAAGLVLGVLLAAGAYQYRSSQMQQDIAQRILRFHVIANSDSKEDQALKLKIRDRIGAYLKQELKDVDNLQECVAVVEKDRTKIADCAKEVIAREGYDYPVDVMVADVDFPVKTYGMYTFPAGNYQALEVIIGEGAGQNWWCVMYPNLCFANSVYEVIDENSQKQLRAVLTEEEYEEVMAEGKIEVKFRYFEKLKELIYRL